MAEFIFDCPACKQPVQADDAWTGQETQCPVCQSPITIPRSPSPPPQAKSSLGRQFVEVPGQTKLSAGATQTPRSASGTGAPLKSFAKPKSRKSSPALKYATIGVVGLALVAIAWFGWPLLRPHLPFLNPATEDSPSGSEVTAGAEAQFEATPVSPQVTEPPPMRPPTFTLDVAAATISEGMVNGRIGGTNFVPDTVRLNGQAGVYVLELRQGAGVTPDRGLRVHLKLNPTESPTGRTWTVSQDMKGTPITRVVKVWKTNPKYAAQEKFYTTGFALKLEFGQLTESNTLPGKIYAALPDAEQSVVGGVFSAMTGMVGPSGTVVTPQPMQIPPESAERGEFERRYGIRPPPR